jgi:hypothetical protein
LDFDADNVQVTATTHHGIKRHWHGQGVASGVHRGLGKEESTSMRKGLVKSKVEAARATWGATTLEVSRGKEIEGSLIESLSKTKL